MYIHLQQKRWTPVLTSNLRSTCIQTLLANTNFHIKQKKKKGQSLTFHNQMHPATERKNTWDLTQQSSWSFTVGACATFKIRNTGRHGNKKITISTLNGGDCYTTFLKRCMNHWFLSIRCRNLHSNLTWKVQNHFKLQNKTVSHF